MIIIIQFIFLIGVFIFSFSIHKKINSSEQIVVPSNIQTKKENIEEKNINNDNKEIIEIKKVDTIKHKQKIKNTKKTKNIKNKENNIKQNNEVEKNIDKNFNKIEEQPQEQEEKIYIITEERLKDIENNEEDKEFLKNKIAFEKQLEEINDNETINGYDLDINYSEMFSQERKKKISEDILKSTDLKWYEQNGDGSSIEKVLPQNNFIVKEYDF